MHIQVNANPLVFFRTSKSAVSSRGSFAPSQVAEEEVDEEGREADGDEDDRDGCEDEGGVLDDVEEEIDLSDEEKSLRKIAASERAQNGYASKGAKETKKRGLPPRCGRGRKAPGRGRKAKSPHVGVLEERSSSSTPNQFYADSEADSEAGTLARVLPDEEEPMTAQAGTLRDPVEAEKMRITRAIDERMLKVHEVECRPLWNGEEPEDFVIDIPNRFIR